MVMRVDDVTIIFAVSSHKSDEKHTSVRRCADSIITQRLAVFVAVIENGD